MPKIFGQANPDMFLKLEQEPSGGVNLILVNSEGTMPVSGKVLCIMNDGMLYLYPGINRDAAKSAGIRLNSKGEIPLS